MNIGPQQGGNPVKTPEVTMVIDQLTNTIGALQAVLQQLGEKLGPVLRLEPIKGDVKTESAYGTPLAQRLESLTGALEREVRTVQDFVYLIEL